VTDETTLEPAAENTSSEDPVAEDTPTPPDAITETDIDQSEQGNDDVGVADVPEVTSTMTKADVAGDATITEVCTCMAGRNDSRITAAFHSF
jgi:hypothetical protein